MTENKNGPVQLSVFGSVFDGFGGVLCVGLFCFCFGFVYFFFPVGIFVIFTL